jgi:hypothetical protein
VPEKCSATEAKFNKEGTDIKDLLINDFTEVKEDLFKVVINNLVRG